MADNPDFSNFHPNDAFLLGAMLGSQANQPQAPQGDAITVTGHPPAIPAPRDNPMQSLYNNDPTVPDQGNQIQPSDGSFHKRHGLGGIVNGILETLGDVALVQSGLKPYFGPHHMNNLMVNATQGFQNNPDQAIANVNQFDPATAQAMYQKRIDDLRAARGLDIQSKWHDDNFQARKDSAEDQERGREFIRQQKFNDQADRVLGSATNADDYATKYNTLASRATTLFGKDGKNYLLDNGYDEDYDPNFVTSLKTGSMTEKDREQAASSKTNADAHMINATRPRPARIPPNPTMASLVDKFIQIPPEERTPDQQAIIDKFVYHATPKGSASSAGSSTTPAAGPPANAGKWVIRNGKPVLVK